MRSWSRRAEGIRAASLTVRFEPFKNPNGLGATVGFYVRKSLKAGPFRFNLSKSGVGVSVGVPGFRVGTGPRGNYVRTGRHGVYYGSSTHQRVSKVPGSVESAGRTFDPNEVVLDDVTGATTVELQPTGGDDVVDQLNAAARSFTWGWLTLIVAVALGAATLPWGVIVWVAAVPLCWWVFLSDGARKKVIIFYEVDDASALWFARLVEQWAWLSDSQKMWRTVAAGAVSTPHQHKRNAGASALVERIAAAATDTGPPHLVTNVAVPSLIAGKMSLHFLPDRVLLREGKSYTDISYRFLDVHGATTRFIENPGSVPRDTEQIGETWQYVNKNGGPDRRFSNNRRLPVVQYGELTITSRHGLSWVIQVSRADAARAISGPVRSVPLSEVA